MGSGRFASYKGYGESIWRIGYGSMELFGKVVSHRTTAAKEDIEDNTLLAIIGASLSLNSTNHENTQESQEGQTNNWARAGRIFSMRRDFRSSGWQ